MYCSVSITRPEHYVQAILCEVLFEFESQNVGSVYSQQQQKNDMAGKFTVGTPNILEKEKCGILMLKENIGNLATCFKALNGTMELSQKA